MKINFLLTIACVCNVVLCIVIRDWYACMGWFLAMIYSIKDKNENRHRQHI